MAVLLLILQILSAIPSLIKLVKEIWDLIDGQDGLEKKALRKELADIIKKHRANKFKDPDAAEKDLMAFHEHLLQKYT